MNLAGNFFSLNNTAFTERTRAMIGFAFPTDYVILPLNQNLFKDGVLRKNTLVSLTIANCEQRILFVPLKTRLSDVDLQDTIVFPIVDGTLLMYPSDENSHIDMRGLFDAIREQPDARAILITHKIISEIPQAKIYITHEDIKIPEGFLKRLYHIFLETDDTDHPSTMLHYAHGFASFENWRTRRFGDPLQTRTQYLKGIRQEGSFPRTSSLFSLGTEHQTISFFNENQNLQNTDGKPAVETRRIDGQIAQAKYFEDGILNDPEPGLPAFFAKRRNGEFFIYAFVSKGRLFNEQGDALSLYDPDGKLCVSVVSNNHECYVVNQGQRFDGQIKFKATRFTFELLVDDDILIRISH